MYYHNAALQRIIILFHLSLTTTDKDGVVCLNRLFLLGGCTYYYFSCWWWSTIVVHSFFTTFFVSSPDRQAPPPAPAFPATYVTFSQTKTKDCFDFAHFQRIPPTFYHVCIENIVKTHFQASTYAHATSSKK